MKRSLNEISGMVVKAARGAGVPLGHCEDLGAAAVYLAATDPVRLDCVIGALNGPHLPVDMDGLVFRNARAAMAGPIAVDAVLAGTVEVTLEDIDAPRLVLAMCASRGANVDHRNEGNALILKQKYGELIMPVATSVTVSDLLWDQLNTLAAKTYVPATEASRLAGAGAGLTDND